MQKVLKSTGTGTFSRCCGSQIHYTGIWNLILKVAPIWIRIRAVSRGYYKIMKNTGTGMLALVNKQLLFAKIVADRVH